MQLGASGVFHTPPKKYTLNNPDGVGPKTHSQPVVGCLIHLMASHLFFRLRAWLALRFRKIQIMFASPTSKD